MCEWSGLRKRSCACHPEIGLMIKTGQGWGMTQCRTAYLPWTMLTVLLPAPTWEKKFLNSHMAVLMCMNNLTENQHWLSSVSQTEWKCAFQNYHHEVLITNMVALGGESLRGDWMWMRSCEQNTHFGICSFRRRDTKIIRIHARTQRESGRLHVKRRPEQEDLNLEDSWPCPLQYSGKPERIPVLWGTKSMCSVTHPEVIKTLTLRPRWHKNNSGCLQSTKRNLLGSHRWRLLLYILLPYLRSPLHPPKLRVSRWTFRWISWLLMAYNLELPQTNPQLTRPWVNPQAASSSVLLAGTHHDSQGAHYPWVEWAMSIAFPAAYVLLAVSG